MQDGRYKANPDASQGRGRQRLKEHKSFKVESRVVMWNSYKI